MQRVVLLPHISIPFFKMKEIKSNPPKTLLAIIFGFVLFYFIYGYEQLIIIAFLLNIIGLLSNRLSKYVENIWFFIAKVLGYIIPNMLLMIIFYLFLFPISVFSKIRSKDLLNLKKNKETNFISVEKKFDSNTFKKT